MQNNIIISTHVYLEKAFYQTLIELNNETVDSRMQHPIITE